MGPPAVPEIVEPVAAGGLWQLQDCGLVALDLGRVLQAESGEVLEGVQSVQALLEDGAVDGGRGQRRRRQVGHSARYQDNMCKVGVVVFWQPRLMTP